MIAYLSQLGIGVDMKTIRFTEDATISVGTARGGQVRFILPAAQDLGGGAITAQVLLDGAVDTIGIALVAGLENSVAHDFGPELEYQLVLAGSTNPDVAVVVTGT